MGYIFDAIHRLHEQETRPAAQEPERGEGAEEGRSGQTLPPLMDPQASDAPIATPTLASSHETAETADVAEPASPIEHDAAPSSKPKLSLAADARIDTLDDRLVAVREPSSLMAEEYRAIRTSLLARWEHRRKLVHTITSATPQEGKTLTSLNLGLSFAELRNRRTVVIEADLRLPTFQKLLRTPDTPGLVGVLRGEATLDEVIQTVGGEHPLDVIAAGRRCSNESVQLLSGPRMTELLAALRKRYDHIIIDTPPVIELADAGIVGSMSDEVLLIIRMNRTPRPLVDQSIRTLTSYHAPVAGVIATDAVRSRNKYYYYRYGYRYRYHDQARKAA